MKQTPTTERTTVRGLLSIAAVLAFFWLACGAPLYEMF
jgi:hypothetical protein